MIKENKKCRWEDLTLSFFKDNNINYYLERPLVIFPCFYCNEEAKHHIEEQKWACGKCGKHGKFVDLIAFLKDNSAPKKKVYNPRVERYEISKALKNLIKASQNNSKVEKELIKIHNKMNTLWSYSIGEFMDAE